jgi:hypothetical protein
MKKRSREESNIDPPTQSTLGFNQQKRRRLTDIYYISYLESLVPCKIMPKLSLAFFTKLSE